MLGDRDNERAFNDRLRRHFDEANKDLYRRISNVRMEARRLGAEGGSRWALEAIRVTREGVLLAVAGALETYDGAANWNSSRNQRLLEKVRQYSRDLIRRCEPYYMVSDRITPGAVEVFSREITEIEEAAIAEIRHHVEGLRKPVPWHARLHWKVAGALGLAAVAGVVGVLERCAGR